MKKFVVSKNRELKFYKIFDIIFDYTKSPIKNKLILDIGTGTGEIADFFNPDNHVFSVDILDQRVNKNSSTTFIKISDEILPFKSGSFDIVISNHTIEHVIDQKLHLAEIFRILRSGGLCYLATPNKLFPYECHYKTWLIHYFPQNLYIKILNLLGLYKEDLHLLPYFKTIKLISTLFEVEEYTHKVAKFPTQFHLKIPILNMLPLALLKRLNFISQTNIFILLKK